MDDQLDSHEIMKWLNDVQRARFVKFQELFESDAWPMIVEIATVRATEFGIQGANAKDWHEHGVAYGARMAWDEVSGLEAAVMAQFQTAALAASEEASETDDEDSVAMP